MRALSPLAAITLIWSIDPKSELQVANQKFPDQKTLYFAFTFAIWEEIALVGFVEAKSVVAEFSTVVET